MAKKMNDSFHQKLKEKIDSLVHLIYRATRSFPKDEMYGVTSQLRRAVLSIALNYVEGYARSRNLVLINFLEISYGSLQETKYLINFSFKEKYLKEPEYGEAVTLGEEIGAMLWQTIKGLRAKST